MRRIVVRRREQRPRVDDVPFPRPRTTTEGRPDVHRFASCRHRPPAEAGGRSPRYPVNTNAVHYELARKELTAFPDRVTDARSTHGCASEDVGTAFETGDDAIEIVVEFSTR